MKKLVLSIVMMLAAFSLMARSTQPNILFILTDDMGYSDVGFNQVENSPVNDIVTPNIDALANDGTIFSSAYAVHMFCGPSRAGIMTGRYPHKIGSHFNLASFSEYGIDSNETFISKVLQDAGYYTSVIGKWHLGEEDEYHPNNRGYDHFYGFLGGGHRYFSKDWKTVSQTENLFATSKEGNFASYSVALMRNHETLENPTENLYLTDMLTTEGVAVVNDAKAADKPFFLFMSYNAPHTLLEAKDADIAALKAAPYNIDFGGDENRATYSAMMYALDKQIKVLIDQLKANGQYDNTMIVFMSDNGGKIVSNASANNHPLTGGKGNIEEGGIRVPMFIHWPTSMTGAPAKYEHVVSGLDLYPTFVNVANATVPAGKALDGVDLVDSVLNNKDVRPDKAIFNLNVKTPNNYVQARQGKYKALTHGNGTWILYDLEADITESTSVNNVEILKSLTDQAKAWAQTHNTPEWFDNPDWGWEQKWADNNMPNWERTFPADLGELPEGVVAVNLKWKDGKTDDRPLEQGAEDALVFTYNSGVDTKAYLLAESKTGGNWGDVWYSKEVDLVQGLGNTVEIPLIVPADQELNAFVRIYMASEDNGGFGKRLLPNQLRYADIIAPGGGNTGGGDTGGNTGGEFGVTNLRWDDGSKTGKEIDGNAKATVMFDYTGAATSDVLYLRVASKDAWGTFWASETINFTQASGTMSVDFDVKAHTPGDADANRVRAILSLKANGLWGDRFDVAADGSAGNDGIFGDIIEGTGGGGSDTTGTGGTGDAELEITNFSWDDGSKDDKELADDQTASVKFAYANASITDTLYLRLACKDNWGVFWVTEMITFADASGEKTVDFSPRAFDGANADANRVRAILTKSATGVWGDRFDVGADENSNNDAIYGDIVAVDGGSDKQLSITNLTWDDGTKEEKSLTAGEKASVKFSYADASTTDTLYLRIASKDNWGVFWADEVITFTETSGDMTVDFDVRAYDATNADANRTRAMLTTSATGVWSDRFDVGADENSANDAIYGDVVEGTSALNRLPEVSLLVYPNPSNGVFSVSLESAAEMMVCDLTGKVILRQAAKAGINQFELHKTGMYILSVKHDKGIGTQLIQVK